MTKPADTPFPHTGECKTLDAKPEWFSRGDGVWERVCSCHTEIRYPAAGRRPDPLDPKLMKHGPGCDIADNPHLARRVVTLKVESSYTFASCTVCGWNWYAWDPAPGRNVAGEIEAEGRREARAREAREARINEQAALIQKRR
jgi:hypothetical protein